MQTSGSKYLFAEIFVFFKYWLDIDKGFSICFDFNKYVSGPKEQE